MPPNCPEMYIPSGGEPEMSVSNNKLAAESWYHKPDPLVWLLGHGNEGMVVVERIETTAQWTLCPKSLPLLRDSAQKWG